MPDIEWYTLHPFPLNLLKDKKQRGKNWCHFYYITRWPYVSIGFRSFSECKTICSSHFECNIPIYEHAKCNSEAAGTKLWDDDREMSDNLSGIKNKICNCMQKSGSSTSKVSEAVTNKKYDISYMFWHR